MATNDLSLKIPALATKMWTPPKASKAALTRASPSSAEHTAAVALPPADGLLSAGNSVYGSSSPRTSENLVNDSLGVLLAHIIHDHVGSQSCQQQRIRSTETGSGTCDDCRLSVVPNLRRSLPVWRSISRGLQFALRVDKTSDRCLGQRLMVRPT